VAPPSFHRRLGPTRRWHVCVHLLAVRPDGCAIDGEPLFLAKRRSDLLLRAPAQGDLEDGAVRALYVSVSRIEHDLVWEIDALGEHLRHAQALFAGADDAIVIARTRAVRCLAVGVGELEARSTSAEGGRQLDLEEENRLALLVREDAQQSVVGERNGAATVADSYGELEVAR
jgi:hypothetical protein